MSRIYSVASADRMGAVPSHRRVPEDDEEEDDEKPAHDEEEDDEEGDDERGDDRGDGYSE